jgi:hypothetical protein
MSAVSALAVVVGREIDVRKIELSANKSAVERTGLIFAAVSSQASRESIADRQNVRAIVSA